MEDMLLLTRGLMLPINDLLSPIKSPDATNKTLKLLIKISDIANKKI
jgi:hypothetical protein